MGTAHATRGEGIHWPQLDEDISVDNLLSGSLSGESQRSFKQLTTLKLTASRSARYAPASVSGDDRTTRPRVHVSVTVPSSHPGRREVRPADRTSRPLHRLLQC